MGTSTLRIAGRSTRVELEGRPGAELVVKGGRAEVRDDGTIEVTPTESRVQVTCPEHADVVISTASGSVRISGHVASLKVITASGKVDVERAVDVDVRTRSGSVSIDSCVNACRIVTSSGAVSVGDAHDVDVSTMSAKVRVGRTDLADVRTTSGSVVVGAGAWARVAARSMSGRVEIALPRGSAATMRLSSTSGRIERDVPEGEGATVDVSTMSGAIRVGSA
ncbi:MAG: DUF4097 family beta strand repeat-containing protein [Acidimicrobiales bacterium]